MTEVVEYYMFVGGYFTPALQEFVQAGNSKALL